MSTFSDFRRELRGLPGKVLGFSFDGPGAIIGDTLRRVAQGERIREDDVLAAMGGAASVMSRSGGPLIIPGPAGGKATAIVDIVGVILCEAHMPPFCTGALQLARVMKALAADSEIGQIILNGNSPGGVVTGVPEAADAVYTAAKRKKVTGRIRPLSASACYWIMSQATELVSMPSGDVGGVGVFLAHTDCSKFNEAQGLKVTYIFDGEYKVEGNPDEPLSAEARAYYQSEVSTIGRQFRRAVARGRNVSVETVENDFGKGRCMAAPAAKRAGLIDRIVADPDEVLFAGPSSNRAARLAQLSAPTKREAEVAARRARLEELGKSSNPEAVARARRLRLEELR